MRAPEPNTVVLTFDGEMYEVQSSLASDYMTFETYKSCGDLEEAAVLLTEASKNLAAHLARQGKSGQV